jgi:hypothetical protein
MVLSETAHLKSEDLLSALQILKLFASRGESRFSSEGRDSESVATGESL